MAASIRAILSRYATRRVVLAALAGFVACVGGLAWRQDRLGGLRLLDVRGWYTPAEAAMLFEALDRFNVHARALYAVTGLTIDMLFPVAYGLLFAMLLLRLFRTPLYILPLALATADVLENATVAVLALGYAGAPSSLAWMAATFTLIKTVLIVAVMAAAGLGVVRWLWLYWRR